MAVAVVGGGGHDIFFSFVEVHHAYALILAYAELYLSLSEYLVYHLLRLLHYVVVYGIVVEHVEVGGIYSHLHLVDELAVVQIHRLHGLCIHLSGKEQISLRYALALEVAEESLRAGVLAEQVYENRAQQEDGSCDTGIFQSEGCTYFHYSLLVSMKPTPGLVCISFTSKFLSIFLRR